MKSSNKEAMDHLQTANFNVAENCTGDLEEAYSSLLWYWADKLVAFEITAPDYT